MTGIEVLAGILGFLMNLSTGAESVVPIDKSEKTKTHKQESNY